MRARTLLLCCLAFLRPAVAKDPFTFEAMMKLARVSEPALSPDGKTIAFTVRRIDLDGNKSSRQIYTVPVAGGAPTAITKEGNNDRPRWTPDGKQLVFISTRSGSSQVWIMNADGGAARPVTNLATEASG
ncbi:MAG: S9 family peptidase, partial [Bryobacteraceae bacterium]|nr:S9 family peptidase [Bryobacteraceae bacterium]